MGGVGVGNGYGTHDVDTKKGIRYHKFHFCIELRLAGWVLIKKSETGAEM